jgi:prepilin-type N-terminal cleavage/methylation domain-containing protein
MLNEKRSVFGDRGFTLVESLIAILLLGIIFSGGMAFYYLSNALYYSGLHSRIATSLASSQMEVCKNEGFARISDNSETICRQSGASVQVGELSGSTRTVTVSNGPSSDLLQVNVTVNWTDPSRGAQSVTLQTYVGS